MDNLISALVLIFIVLRALYAFFRWIIKGLKGVSGAAATPGPAQPMARQLPGASQPPQGQQKPNVGADRDQAPRWQHRPETTATDFRAAERQNLAQLAAASERRTRTRYRPVRRPDTPKQPTKRAQTAPIEPAGLPTLLSTSSELLRGIILHEILAPPISQRGDPRGRGSF